MWPGAPARAPHARRSIAIFFRTASASRTRRTRCRSYNYRLVGDGEGGRAARGVDPSQKSLPVHEADVWIRKDTTPSLRSRATQDPGSPAEYSDVVQVQNVFTHAISRCSISRNIRTFTLENSITTPPPSRGLHIHRCGTRRDVSVGLCSSPDRRARKIYISRIRPGSVHG